MLLSAECCILRCDILFEDDLRYEYVPQSCDISVLLIEIESVNLGTAFGIWLNVGVEQ